MRLVTITASLRATPCQDRATGSRSLVVRCWIEDSRIRLFLLFLFLSETLEGLNVVRASETTISRILFTNSM